MGYLGKHRAERPLVMRSPVVGGVLMATLLAWPVLLVTGNVNGESGHRSRFAALTDASRQPTSVPDVDGSSPGSTSIPIDDSDSAVSIADGGTAAGTRTTGGWSAASHSGDSLGLVAGPRWTAPTGGTTEPTRRTTEPADKPTSKPTKSTSKPTKPPTSSSKPPTSTQPPADPTTEPPADPTTDPVEDPTTAPEDPPTTPTEPAVDPVEPETTEPTIEATTDPTP